MLPSYPLVALVGLLALASQALAVSPPPEIVLSAIRIVETGDNRRSVGRAGERGAYQFRAATWRQHSRQPFHLAHTRYADVVARRHYTWLVRNLERAGRPADAYHIALAWNAGLHRTTHGRPAAASRSYATRVQNLATALQRDSLARSQ